MHIGSIYSQLLKSEKKIRRLYKIAKKNNFNEEDSRRHREALEKNGKIREELEKAQKPKMNNEVLRLRSPHGVWTDGGTHLGMVCGVGLTTSGEVVTWDHRGDDDPKTRVALQKMVAEKGVERFIEDFNA